MYHILKKILSHQKYYTTDTNNKYKNLDLYNGPNRQDIKTRGSLELKINFSQKKNLLNQNCS
jgi:hypothetical protein